MQGNTLNNIIKNQKIQKWKNLQFHNTFISIHWKVIENKTNMEFGSGGSHQEMPSAGIYEYYFGTYQEQHNLFIYLEFYFSVECNQALTLVSLGFEIGWNV